MRVYRLTNPGILTISLIIYLGKKQSKRTYKKTPWSNEEKEVVLREMRHLIKKKSLPGKDICSMLIEKYPVLANRKWTDVKFFVKNYLSKKR